MIKFFRRIRKSLLMENKTGKYFKYAIGEILLVMIGILLALQVNNWNENRKHLKQQDFLFTQLLSDAKADSVFFKSRLLGLELLDSTLINIKQFGMDSTLNISTINTNGTGKVLPIIAFRHASNLLDNNPNAYQELLDNEIKDMLRDYNAKYSYVSPQFLFLNTLLEKNRDIISRRYYKELRENKRTKSIKTLSTIYKDVELQSDVDNIRIALEAAHRRTNEFMGINKNITEALTNRLNND